MTCNNNKRITGAQRFKLKYIYIYIYIYIYMCVCVCVRVRACVRACVFVCVCVINLKLYSVTNLRFPVPAVSTTSIAPKPSVVRRQNVQI